jgi:hypothetical protein
MVQAEEASESGAEIENVDDNSEEEAEGEDLEENLSA